MKYIKNVLEAIVGSAIAAILFGLIIVLFFNLAGLLFGFQNPSTGCNNYFNKNQTNFEYYFMPITPYACKENGGLLQPAVSDFFKWFGDKKK